MESENDVSFLCNVCVLNATLRKQQLLKQEDVTESWLPDNFTGSKRAYSSPPAQTALENRDIQLKGWLD